ncbi:helix-turn-helix domain-containing protein [Nordella sp. HKS 07]|uniref:AraC family transcriptional regulator n=1 Tax=Nordella sp. HKS 07 TaxID=2712222 RepID=UPI0013E1D378|nr:helix-turn-helix domain-containing protein [Nordella sp. HKS 07]QIG46899.1 helix-turn-helix domain-containing protein [Nordella sp. HKS 07]
MNKLVWDEFSTSLPADGDRFPIFHAEMADCQAVLGAIAQRDTHFMGILKRCRLGSVAVIKVSASTMSQIRASELTYDSCDAVVAVICIDGSILCTQGETPFQLGPGEGVLCDGAEAGGLHMGAGASCWALQVMRADLAKAAPHIKRFVGLKLGTSGLAVRLLTKYLDGLQDSETLGDAEEVRVFGEHLIDLIRMAIAYESGALQLAERRGVRAARHAAVLREIERKLAQSTLSAASVAATLGVTPRYVHFLLAESGLTFSEHVLARRLKAVGALLADAGKSTLKISAVARQAGFTDMSYFNRSFRAHYGDTPSGFRKRMTSETADCDDVAA